MAHVTLGGRPLRPIRLSSEEPASVIDELVAAFGARAGLAVERIEALRVAVHRREESLSTGLEQGIAVPHGVLERLERLEWVAGVQPAGIDWPTLDGSRVRIVVLFAVPERCFGDYLAALGELLGQLRGDDTRRAFLGGT